MSGDEGEKAREARAFGRWAAETASLPVRYWDERYTSTVAEGHLLAASLSKKKRLARLDMLAAQVMLQSYLDAADRERAPGAL
jgi:putative Holliday junction resolvase